MEKIAMALTNDLLNDARVTKMATTLSKEYEVVVVCIDQGRNVDYSIFPFRVVSVEGDSIVKATQSIRKSGRKLPPVIRNILKDFSLYTMLRKNASSLEKALFNENANIYTANDLETLEAVTNVALTLDKGVVYDSHELCPECYSRTDIGLKIWKWHERKLLPRVNSIITTNKYRANIIKDHYSLKHRPYVVGNIPMKSKIQFKEADDTIDLVYVGGISEGRGLLEFVYAMKELPDYFRLNFLGFGGLEKKVETIVRDSQLEGKVVFHESVKSSEVVDTISKFDIGIVTYIPDNLNNYYCSPNKLYEYIQAGLGIVSIDLPEPHDVIKECNNGFLFKEYTTECISNTIKRFDIKNVNQFKKNSLVARSKYNWETQEDLILSIYKGVR
jgi:glycosyltransferase involved in cell wall biosynthesis